MSNQKFLEVIIFTVQGGELGYTGKISLIFVLNIKL